MRWLLSVIVSTAATLPCASAAGDVTVEALLPFTPAVDAVRLQATLTTDRPARQVELTASLRLHGTTESVWSGALGGVELTNTGPTTIDRVLTDLPVEPWSPGSPRLYDLTLSVQAGSEQLAEGTVRFGFRTIESRHGSICLNGKPIFLRGLAINPPGRSIPSAVGESRQFAWDYVQDLRRRNVNIIRLEHDDQDWFDVCDELGMMVYQGFYGSPPAGPAEDDEPSESSLAAQDEAVGKKLPQDIDSSVAGYVERFETYVRHPSIVIYVLSNELPYKGDAGEHVHEFLSQAHERLRTWDETRLFIGNAGYGEGREGDINDVHRYWGWYYNTFLTYYNLRDPQLFGDPTKLQPFTFSECVGNFTGPNGAYNCIERKQLAAQLCWTGTAAVQSDLAQEYQAFMVREACESFRRMRSINPHLSGIMPFTIAYRNWRGIQSFDQMEPGAAADQFRTSYQPVLLSWENWQTQVAAGATVRVFAHIVNDADDFTALDAATLHYALRGPDERIVAKGEMAVPRTEYYANFRAPVEIALREDLPTGEYVLSGDVTRYGEVISTNESRLFVAAADWRSTSPPAARRVLLYDPEGDSTAAIARAGVRADAIADVTTLNPLHDCLVIGQEAWDAKLSGSRQELRRFVALGGRVLCLGQRLGRFDADWLPAGVELCERSVNDPEYMTPERPTYDQMHVNPQRPEHPVFDGIDRRLLRVWSDDSDWDQTQPGFPRVYPVQFGFELTEGDDLEHTAILADYDAGLQGVALCEMFDGGSVLLCGLDVARRNGVDPVADRLLGNLISYMAGESPHKCQPLVSESIRWGDYATHQGVLTGPIQGLFLNTEWLPPPTALKARPASKEGGWNTRPGDQFVPCGVRPRGPFSYTFNCAVRDGDDSEDGTGQFRARLPAGRRYLVSTVRNPRRNPISLLVAVNDSESRTEIGPGEEVEIRTPIPEEALDVCVRYSGNRDAVIVESAFE